VVVKLNIIAPPIFTGLLYERLVIAGLSITFSISVKLLSQVPAFGTVL